MPSVTDVFSEGLALTRDNYLKVLALMVLLFVIIAVIAVILGITIFAGVFASHSLHNISATLISGFVSSTIIFIVIITIVSVLIGPIFSGAYYAIAMQYLKKKELTLSKALAVSKNSYKGLLWTSVIQTVIMIIILAIVFSPLALSVISLISNIPKTMPSSNTIAEISNIVQSAGIGIIATLLLVLVTAIVALIVSFVLSVLFYEAVPLVMLKGKTGISAIKESFRIGRRYFWSIIGLLILFGLFDVAISIIVNVVSAVLIIINPVVGLIGRVVLTVLLEALIVGLSGFLPILFYARYVGK